MSDTLDAPRGAAREEPLTHGRYFDKRCHEVRAATATALRKFCDDALEFDADASVPRSDLTRGYREWRGDTISEAVAASHIYDLVDWLRIRRVGDHYVGIGLKP